MSVFEFVLLFVGAALVAVSFMVGEKLTGTNEESPATMDTKELKSQSDQFKKEIEDYLEKAKETTIDSVNDSLCHLSNEKIMSVSEYGDMVLERIDKNHTEVVFLYGMLNDKEKELKQILVQPHQKEAELKKTVEKVVKKDEQPKTEAVVKPTRKAAGKVNSLKGSQAENVERAMQDLNTKADHEAFEVKQEKILALYKKGKTVLDISKQLDIGQGEVQLVVNLFTGGLQ